MQSSVPTNLSLDSKVSCHHRVHQSVVSPQHSDSRKENCTHVKLLSYQGFFCLPSFDCCQLQMSLDPTGAIKFFNSITIAVRNKNKDEDPYRCCRNVVHVQLLRVLEHAGGCCFFSDQDSTLRCYSQVHSESL